MYSRLVPRKKIKKFLQYTVDWFREINKISYCVLSIGSEKVFKAYCSSCAVLTVNVLPHAGVLIASERRQKRNDNTIPFYFVHLIFVETGNDHFPFSSFNS